MLGVSSLFNRLVAAHNNRIPDVEVHHLETAHQLEFTKLEISAEGPLRASLKAETTYGKSKISVTVSDIDLYVVRYPV